MATCAPRGLAKRQRVVTEGPRKGCVSTMSLGTSTTSLIISSLCHGKVLLTFRGSGSGRIFAPLRCTKTPTNAVVGRQLSGTPASRSNRRGESPFLLTLRFPPLTFPPRLILPSKPPTHPDFETPSTSASHPPPQHRASCRHERHSPWIPSCGSPRPCARS